MLAGMPGTSRRALTVWKNCWITSGQEPIGSEWQEQGGRDEESWSDSKKCWRKISWLSSRGKSGELCVKLEELLQEETGTEGTDRGKKGSADEDSTAGSESRVDGDRREDEEGKEEPEGG